MLTALLSAISIFTKWCHQDYLSLNDPNRIFLDSLFRARLADLGMKTQTAVRCKRKEKTTISYTRRTEKRSFR